jgi:ABC-type dipeptide/oligopeptide/nickel transport system permease component
VFFIFNSSPGDPVRVIAGQNDSEEVLEQIRHNLGLDLPLGKRYLLYLNDISPLSLHDTKDPESRVYLDEDQYSALEIVDFSEHRTAVLKAPYLRKSYKSNRSVSAIISDALPGTLILAVTAILIGLTLGLIIGVLSALKKDSYFDKVALVISVFGMSGPSFFMAIIIAFLGGLVWHEATILPMWPLLLLLGGIVFGAIRKSRAMKVHGVEKLPSVSKFAVIGFLLGMGVWLFGETFEAIANVDLPLTDAMLTFPGTGLEMTGSLYSVDVWKGEYLTLENLILPALTLGIRPLGVVVQLTRSSMLEVMSMDYIRTARAKGLSEWKVVLKHALKNALNPVVTAVSGWFASLLAGAVFVEFIFGWKGLGLEIFTSLQKEDLPVVMGSVIVIASTFVLLNILVDILYGVIDPRVRIGKES